MSDQPVRTRFAPSPTGFVHIGSLRTALFSFLFARHSGGTHILRIEDTDQNRQVEGAEKNLLQVLGQLGIEFDEGLQLTASGELTEVGESGPYVQSKRLDIYNKHINQLLEQGNAYYCFCSEERLSELRKEQVALKKPPMYDRLCRNLPKVEVEAKLAEAKASGKLPVVRFAIPLEGSTTIHDLVFGDIEYEHKVLDDQVLLKSDGFPTYHFAVVVDDHYMNITHVIRGNEWIPSTPKHLLLYQAFGWTPTQFAHLPLIVNPDKTKLSKRQGDVSVEDFLKKGYLTTALVNFVALLGWNPKTEQELFTLKELIAQFELSKVNKSPAVFDQSKLDWINAQYIRKLNPTALVELLKPYWTKGGIRVDQYKPEFLEGIAQLEQDRLKKLSEITERTNYFFSDFNLDPSQVVWKKSTPGQTKQILQQLIAELTEWKATNPSAVEIEQWLKEFVEKQGTDTGSVFWPVRFALTGETASPGPHEVASVLWQEYGKEKVMARLKSAVDKLA